jgi:hypothetical protein
VHSPASGWIPKRIARQFPINRNSIGTPGHIRERALTRFLFTMKKNLIALTFLGLVAIFLGGCTTTSETTTTTERTREQSSMYAR